jgi:hypothetical protein
MTQSKTSDMKHPRLYFQVVLFFMALPLSGQDLFDSLGTARYADFLFNSGNYREAAEEYERLLFLSDPDEEKKIRLIQSYRLSDRASLARQRMYAIWERPAIVSPPVANEFFFLRILDRDFHGLEASIQENPVLTDDEKLFYLASAFLYQDDFQRADELLADHVNLMLPALQRLQHISGDAVNLPLRSPVVGGVLSALLPGSGKFYAGNWEDGLISMVMVGMSAWQAYRGFERRGTGSVYAWSYAVIGTAFYLGNIYGSVKEVNKYNQHQKDGIRHRVEAVFHHSR